jgi:hypothetical protein
MITKGIAATAAELAKTALNKAVLVGGSDLGRRLSHSTVHLAKVFQKIAMTPIQRTHAPATSKGR